jgi:hypothetical protein
MIEPHSWHAGASADVANANGNAPFVSRAMMPIASFSSPVRNFDASHLKM